MEMERKTTEPAFRYKAFVDLVVDGDTVDVTLDLGFKTLRKECMRLYGVDTPESRTKNVQEKMHGIIVKQYVKEQLEGKTVVLESVKQEKFGRYLANIYLPDGSCINKTLVEKGMAREYFGEKKMPWDFNGKK